MALSYFNSNWPTLEQEFNSDTSSILAPAEIELTPDQLFNNGDFAFPDFYCNNVNSLFEPNNDLFFSGNLNYNDLVNTQEEYFHAPKRQKVLPLDNNHHQQLVYEEFDSFHAQKFPENNYEHLMFPKFNSMPGMTNGFQDYLPEFVIPPLPEFPTSAPPVAAAGGNLSTQSVAARQRRRKITEKTQELAKLVPGGQKMNTAEMFQSAYKYIQFLQAQLGILQFMDSSHDKEIIGDVFQSEELHGFLESPLIQEKLYSTQKCLVPEKFVQTLGNDHRIIESKPKVLKEIEALRSTETTRGQY